MTKNQYGGKVYFLDRSDINTDEIIPAKYLTFIDREPLKPFLLEDLKIDGLDPKTVQWDQYKVIVSRSNFGCGSSREMAVWAFQINGISTIIATNFARIFRENSFNDGMLTIELPEKLIDEIFAEFGSQTDVEAIIDLEKSEIEFTSKLGSKSYAFSLTKFQKELVSFGGLVGFANEKY